MIFEKCTKIEKGEFFQQMILRKLYRVIIILAGPELVLFLNVDVFLFLLLLAMLQHAGS